MQTKTPPGGPDWTILKLLQWTTSYFKSHAIDSPRADAEILLASALNVKRIDLYVRYDQPLNRDELDRFKALIKRRADREPVAYILGTKEFWSLDFAVTPAVLIPRPDTECLVETALGWLAGAAPDRILRVLELGTGSGAVVVAVAKNQERHCYFASDVSEAAVRLARCNAERHGLRRRIGFFCGRWLQPTAPARFDLIVSNPPYVPTGEMVRLQPEILRYEPAGALDGDADGLSCLREIIAAAADHLTPGGRLLLEIGYDQKEAVLALAGQVGRYTDVTVTKDYGARDRVVAMQRR
jgi:release factor glutamine methyltransferase